MIEIKIPPLGESVSSATVSALRKPSGSQVARDEEILELETDKVNQVLYAPQSGTLTLTVRVGDTVSVGAVIGSIDPAGAAGSVPAPAPSPTLSPAPAPVPEIPAPPPPAGNRKKMSALRKTIAARLVEVKNTTALLTTFNEVDLSRVIAIRAQEKESFTKKYGVKLGYLSFFIKATVAALKEIPGINASIVGDEIVSYDTYDMGVAVSTEKGLMVPVLRGCDKLNFGQIEKGLEEYAQKARAGTLAIDDLKGGSFTLTNGGVFGSLFSTPILNPPQSAILGMHAIVKRPVVVDDAIVIRPMMYLALSYDHRLIDGKEAVLFLAHIKHSLEEPSRLLLDL